MSTTSIKNSFMIPALSGDPHQAGDCRLGNDGAAHQGWSRLEMLSLAGWRRQAVETGGFLAVIAVSQRLFLGSLEIPGLPHPFLLPVVLASCHYGVTGGMIATVSASVLYVFGLSPPSAAQDFYAYARMVAAQPAAWLVTALVLGGLRNLHIHQYSELADQFAVCRQHASDLSDGLERAIAEINALERRIAVDTTSVAALSRSLSLIDMSDRRAAAISFGELFRVGTGVGTFTIYLRDRDGYAPAWAVEHDNPRPTTSMESLSSATIRSMMTKSAKRPGGDSAGESESGAGRHLISVPFSDVGSPPMAVIVCELQNSQNSRQFHRRADEFGRLFATVLHTCPNPPSEARS